MPAIEIELLLVASRQLCCVVRHHRLMFGKLVGRSMMGCVVGDRGGAGGGGS